MSLKVDIHKRKIVTKSNNKRLSGCWSIKGIVPMFGKNNVIDDVEIILDVKRNRYFSVSMFLNDTSWVKSVELKEDYDKGIKKLPYILNNRTKHMSESNFKETDILLRGFLEKVNSCGSTDV